MCGESDSDLTYISMAIDVRNAARIGLAGRLPTMIPQKALPTNIGLPKQNPLAFVKKVEAQERSECRVSTLDLWCNCHAQHEKLPGVTACCVLRAPVRRARMPNSRSLSTPGVQGRESEDDKLAAFPLRNVESHKHQLLVR